MKTSTRIALTLVTAASLFVTGTAQAQTTSRIVYDAKVSSKGGSVSQIFSINPDGSGQVQLTSATVGSITPTWSPGQQYIAFARQGIPNNIKVMAAIGEASGGRTFVVGPGNEPDWSPDGTRIVFRKDSPPNLYIVAVDVVAGTAGAPVLFAPGGYRPAWSPDGTKIAFKRYDSPTSANSKIIVRDIATEVEFSISGGVGYNDTPSWKPDGTQIAFGYGAALSSSDVYVANADGSNLTRVTFSNATGFSTFPSWSPSGTELVFYNQSTVRKTTTTAIYKLTLLTGSLSLVRQAAAEPNWAP